MWLIDKLMYKTLVETKLKIAIGDYTIFKIENGMSGKSWQKNQ